MEIFDLGSSVFSPRFGKGVVVRITKGSSHPIKVEFDSGFKTSYQADGTTGCGDTIVRSDVAI